MTFLDVHDALVSVRVAAELCGIPISRVISMLSSKIIRPVSIQGRIFVSLRAVEEVIKDEGNPNDSSG